MGWVSWLQKRGIKTGAHTRHHEPESPFDNSKGQQISIKKGWKSILSNQIRLGKPQYKVEEPSWGLVHSTYYYSTYHNILCTIQLLNSPSKRSSYFEPCFDNKQQKLQQWNSPCLTYFFLNFSWFTKQLGNERHNYSAHQCTQKSYFYGVLYKFQSTPEFGGSEKRT